MRALLFPDPDEQTDYTASSTRRGFGPTRSASVINMSRLNLSHFPRTRSDTSDCPIPSRFAASCCVHPRALIRRRNRAIGQYTKTLKLLAANPHHPSLRMHALQERLSGLHSVSINLSDRITLELVITEAEIVPINVGDHDEGY